MAAVTSTSEDTTVVLRIESCTLAGSYPKNEGGEGRNQPEPTSGPLWD